MFNLANLFTAANLISGVLAIQLALSGRLDLAPFAVFCGLVFDFLDGFIARLFKTSGELGKQLDSFADMVTFGVAPGVIMLVVLTIDPISFGIGNLSVSQIQVDYSNWFSGLNLTNLSGNYIPFLALLLPFFSMFRLAKFNLDTRQSESFIGLPTPSMTLFFMVFPLALIYSGEVFQLMFNPFNPWLIVGLILIFGLLMISEVPLFSLKIKSCVDIASAILEPCKISSRTERSEVERLLSSTSLAMDFKVSSIAIPESSNVAI
jgi:CDP-diacylglycerol--serine O-phosphatidyltransferase